MHRIKIGLCLLAIALATTACTRQEEPASATPPPAQTSTSALAPVKNLLLICIDTVRADTFYQLGELQPDSFSAWQDEGVVFSHAASPAPWTVPSLASAFTGLWPVQHGAGLIAGLKKISITLSPPSVLQPNVQTIAQAASDKGFDTTVVSASVWTFDQENAVNINRGFKEFHKYVPKLSTLGDVYWESMVGQWSQLITEQAPDKRALNFVHFIEAHNWHMDAIPKLEKRLASFTPEQRALYRATAPDNACEDEESLYCKRYLVYAHAVGVLRDVVAGMLNTLKEKGQLKDTAVVLFSDHGEEFNDHAGDGRVLAWPMNLEFLGHGLSLYEEQLHVPLIVWHPEMPGAVVDTNASLIDIAPSAAQWLGLDFAPAGEQYRMLHAPVAGSNSGDERILYASHVAESEKQMSARQGTNKAIWYMASDRNNYYDLATDPDERHPEGTDAQVLKFDGLFLEYEQMKQGEESGTASFTDEQIKRLQSIGYLQGVETEDEAQE